MSLLKKMTTVLILIAVVVYGWNAYVILKGRTFSDASHSKVSKQNALVLLDSLSGPILFCDQAKSPFVMSASATAAYTEQGIETAAPIVTVKPRATIQKDTVKLVPPAIGIDGIMWNAQNPIAVIRLSDGSTVVSKQGDVVLDNVTILKIEKSKVQVKYQGHDFWIEK